MKAKLCSVTAATLLIVFINLQNPAALAVFSGYSFSSHTFTPCGASGVAGPTLDSCTASYNTTWDNNTDNFTVVNGIQYWVVPATGSYSIEAAGAKGGNGNGGTGGLGAKIKGTFSLTAGETIRILVGQAGGNQTVLTGGTNSTGGGGGGTFVVRTPFNTNASILVVAGGGGGSGSSSGGGSGQITTSGQTGLGTLSGAGGTNGGGGGGGRSGTAGTASTDGGTGTACSFGAGGGGFFTNGGANCDGSAPVTRGFGFINGGAGGPADSARSLTENTFGGFGGGAGSGHRAPGGGGYSGGGGDGASTGGGGGGSYNSGSNPTNISGANLGDGYVTITSLTPPALSLEISGSPLQVVKGATVVLSSSVNQSGSITFLADGKRIPGCVSIAVSNSSKLCNWKPSVQKSVKLTVIFSQSGSVTARTDGIYISVVKRTGLR